MKYKVKENLIGYFNERNPDKYADEILSRKLLYCYFCVKSISSIQWITRFINTRLLKLYNVLTIISIEFK